MYKRLTRTERFEHSCMVVFARYMEKKYPDLDGEARYIMCREFEKALKWFENQESKIAQYFEEKEAREREKKEQG